MDKQIMDGYLDQVFYVGFTNLPLEEKIETVKVSLEKARADAAVMMGGGGCGYGNILFQRHIAELEYILRYLTDTPTSVPNSPELSLSLFPTGLRAPASVDPASDSGEDMRRVSKSPDTDIGALLRAGLSALPTTVVTTTVVPALPTTVVPATVVPTLPTTVLPTTVVPTLPTTVVPVPPTKLVPASGSAVASGSASAHADSSSRKKNDWKGEMGNKYASLVGVYGYDQDKIWVNLSKDYPDLLNEHLRQKILRDKAKKRREEKAEAEKAEAEKAEGEK